MKTWLTVSEAAEYSGLSRDTIYTACERRELRHARVAGRRTIRVKPEWVDGWLEQHSRGGCSTTDAAPQRAACTATSQGAAIPTARREAGTAAAAAANRGAGGGQHGCGDAH